MIRLTLLSVVLTTIASTAFAQQASDWPGAIDPTARNRNASNQSSGNQVQQRTGRVTNEAVIPRNPNQLVPLKSTTAKRVEVEIDSPSHVDSHHASHETAVKQAAFFNDTDSNLAFKADDNEFKSADLNELAENSIESLALPAKGESKPGFRLPSGMGSLKNVGIGLGVALSLFLGLMWLQKKASPNQRGGLPNQVVQVLGKAPLNAKQQMQLVRLGDKILLLAISQNGTETLGEITDRDEVDAMVEICQSKNSSKIRESFRETLYRVRFDRQSHTSANFSRTA